MKTWKIVLLVFSGLLLLIALDFGFGFVGVFKTKTVGKAQQDAKREVFEQTQSYVEGKRQEALKFYKEFKEAEPEERSAIEEMVSHSFANFDEQKLNEPLKSFVYNCKY
jgi:hypothetical protein